MSRRSSGAIAMPPPTPRVSPNPIRLERMFRAHHAIVWRMLRCRGLQPDVAADATQQVFLIAAERLNDIDADHERAFLIGTALRLAHAARRQSARIQLEEDMDWREALARPNAPEPGAALELIALALSRIDPTLVEVFLLFEVAGFSSQEISRMLGIPVGTVASRLRRARESFRETAKRVELTLRREDRRP